VKLYSYIQSAANAKWLQVHISISTEGQYMWKKQNKIMKSNFGIRISSKGDRLKSLDNMKIQSKSAVES